MFQNVITIPAAAGGVSGVQQFHRAGRVFRCILATAGFRVRPDNEASVNMATGRGFGSAGAETRNRLSFENSTAAPIDVTFYWGLEPYETDPSQVSASVTVTGQNSGSFANGASGGVLTLATNTNTAAFTGVSGANLRKQFIVSNLNKPVAVPNTDIPDVLYVLGVNGLILGAVFPQQSFTFESGGSLTVRNPAAGAEGGSGNSINYSVGEVFYS